MRLPNALRLAKVDSIGPAAGAVVVGVEIWPFAKFESGLVFRVGLLRVRDPAAAPC